MPNAHSDTEITLTRGDLRLTTATLGASLRGLSRILPDGTEVEIITEYRGAENKAGGQGDVLIPFPGRVRDGQYTFDGKTYQMERNDKESPSAIHGFLRKHTWKVDHQTSDEVTFGTVLAHDLAAGYPFSLQVLVTYRLETDGLACEFAITNIGDHAAPIAAGFHPYFTVGSDLIDTDTLTLPFNSYLEFEGLLPTGQVLPLDGTPLDFRKPYAIGATKFNTCYASPTRGDNGRVSIRLESENNGRSLDVWMDKAFDYVVLYSGDPLPESHRRKSLAIEPMTCGSDAFNHPEWGLISLEPGETTRGAWGVTAH